MMIHRQVFDLLLLLCSMKSHVKASISFFLLILDLFKLTFDIDINMSKLMCSSYVRWIFYFLLSNTHHVLGFDDHVDDNDELTFIGVVLMASCAVTPVLLVFVFKFYSKSDRLEREVPIPPPLTRSETASIGRNVTRNISDLPCFKSIRPFLLYSICPTTAKRIMTDLMDTANQTRQFSIIPQLSTLMPHSLSMQIALCQPSCTLLAVIESFDPTTMEFEFLQFLQQLFSIIFRSSNTIQTWGDLRTQLTPFIQVGLLSNEQVAYPRFNNVRNRFKTWYNQTFPHHQQCHQRLDYDSIDGPLCSCSHRPCKSSTSRWSLFKAIAYTFDEYMYNHTFNINPCLAITKLALVIEQKWTCEQVKKHIKQNQDDHKVTDQDSLLFILHSSFFVS
jgi:hypothetical protein